MKKFSLLACFLLAVPLSAEEADHEIHQELRGILTTVVNAINSGNYDAMLPVISENIRATTITQEVLSSRQNASEYFKKWFGPGAFLKKLEMSLNADALTELSAGRFLVDRCGKYRKFRTRRGNQTAAVGMSGLPGGLSQVITNFPPQAALPESDFAAKATALCSRTTLSR